MAKKAVTKSNVRKIFVLDTSVIIYDHTAIKNFAEHDVVIPITVLEELDNFKKGNDTKNFAAREFTRYVDEMSGKNLLQEWTPINGKTHGSFKIEMNTSAKTDAEKIFGERKADHKILNAAIYTMEHNPGKSVILVTKDINLRIKAKSLNLHAEDYTTGKILTIDELYTGRSEMDKVNSTTINTIYEKGSCPSKEVFKKYLDEVDQEKKGLLQSDIDALRKYETKIDDEILGKAPLEFVHAVTEISKKRCR